MLERQIHLVLMRDHWRVLEPSVYVPENAIFLGRKSSFYLLFFFLRLSQETTTLRFFQWALENLRDCFLSGPKVVLPHTHNFFLLLLFLFLLFIGLDKFFFTLFVWIMCFYRCDNAFIFVSILPRKIFFCSKKILWSYYYTILF